MIPAKEANRIALENKAKQALPKALSDVEELIKAAAYDGKTEVVYHFPEELVNRRAGPISYDGEFSVVVNDAGVEFRNALWKEKYETSFFQDMVDPYKTTLAVTITWGCVK